MYKVVSEENTGEGGGGARQTELVRVESSHLAMGAAAMPAELEEPRSGRLEQQPLIGVSGGSLPVSLTYCAVVLRILRIAVPITGSRAIGAVRNFIGGLLLARVDSNTLAAAALIYSTQNMVLYTGSGLLNATSILVARKCGEGNVGQAGAVLREAQLLGLLSAIPIIAILYNIKPILISFGQSPTLVDIVDSYYKALLWSIPPYFCLIAGEQFAFGVKKPLFPVAVNTLGLLIYVGFGYALVFGGGGFPALGAAGLAYAEVIRDYLSLAALELCFFFNRRFKNFNLRDFNLIQNITHLKMLCKIGTPLFFTIGTELSCALALTLLVGRTGKIGLSARHVASEYGVLGSVPAFAIAQAGTILVSEAVGERNLKNMQYYGYGSIGIGITVASALFLMISASPRAFTAPFVDVNDPENEALVDTARDVLLITFSGQIFDFIRILSIRALWGVFITKTPMVINAVALAAIGLSMAFTLGIASDLGVSGVIGGNSIGIFVGACMLLANWYLKSKILPAQNIPTEHLNIQSIARTCCPLMRRIMRNTVEQEQGRLNEGIMGHEVVPVGH